MRFTRTKSLFACLCCFAFASTAVADDASLSTTEKERPTYLNRSFDELATLPSFSMGAPAGLVPSFGVVFAGIGGITKSPGSGDTDGSMAVGMGYGNAQESYGGAVTLGIGSVNDDEDFASTGVLSVSLGRFFSEQLTGVSVGVINLDIWHDGRSMIMTICGGV